MSAPVPPSSITLVVVRHSGGHQNIDIERTFLRFDRPGAPADGEWWEVGGRDSGARSTPWTWDEINWLDDPPCDRGQVQIDAYEWRGQL